MIVVDGSSLTRSELVAVARAMEPVRLSDDAIRHMRVTRRIVESSVERDDAVYGTTTGVGVRKRVRFEPVELARLNAALIADHRVGQGAPAPQELVRATMLRLANGLASGVPGVRPELALRLVEALNDDRQAHVRMLGSTGISDLAPLADLAHHVFPDLPLEAGEALALINNASFFTAAAALALTDLATLVETLTATAALDLEAFAGNLTPLHPAVGELRPFAGLVTELERLRDQLAGSRLWEPGAARNLQDPLTFRGIAQIHGALRDALAYAEAQLAIELNASQGNPLVIEAEARLISAGNYEMLPLAAALDLVRIALVPALTSADERLVKLLQAPLTGLTDSLAARGAERESGLAEYAWIAQSLTAEARLLAQPTSTETGSSTQAEAIEDRVTMAPLGARRLAEMTRLGERLLAVGLVIAGQATELRHGTTGAGPASGIGVGPTETLRRLRRLVPFCGPGDNLCSDLQPLVDAIRSGEFAAS